MSDLEADEEKEQGFASDINENFDDGEIEEDISSNEASDLEDLEDDSADDDSSDSDEENDSDEEGYF